MEFLIKDDKDKISGRERDISIGRLVELLLNISVVETFSGSLTELQLN